jgi:hypothetical protein
MKVTGIALQTGAESRIDGVTYTREYLEQFADSLEGKPVTMSFDSETVVGRVTEVCVTQDGVEYTAEIDDGVDLDDLSIAPALVFGQETESATSDYDIDAEFSKLSAVSEPTDAVGDWEYKE